MSELKIGDRVKIIRLEITSGLIGLIPPMVGRTGEIINFDPFEGVLIELDLKDPNQPEWVWVATKDLELI